MESKYILSIDESGQADPKTFNKSPFFVLSGVIVNSAIYDELREHINQVKYATWKEDWKKVLLRSADIGRGNGVFSKLFDKSLAIPVHNGAMTMFCRDLRRFFKRKYFSVITCLIDKKKAVTTKTISLPKGKKTMKYIWDHNLVYKLAYEQILNTYLKFLVVSNSKGKILAEASSDQQDITLYKQFFRLQSEGLPAYAIDHLEVKIRLSSLSFVTKFNKDCEEEIADLMGYATRLTEEIKIGSKTTTNLNSYDKMIVQGYQNSILQVATTRADPRLRKIAKSIESYKRIP